MATIRCGKCGQTHSSVSEVRACYGSAPAAPSANIFAAPALPSSVTRPMPRMHETQVALLGELRTRVDEGHYAVQDGERLRFLRVNVRNVGGKAGRRVYLDEQASDELYPVRPIATQIKYLQMILRDPRAALVRYGHEIGRCGVCNRTLTDEASRSAGIGPICASRLGASA